MTETSLEALVRVLTRLPESDRPLDVLAVLERDIQAVSSGWPAVIVAADSALCESIVRLLPEAACLTPFNEVVEWLPDDHDILERASVLVAGTSARQLLPRTLMKALEVAASAGAPILLVVEAMGRTRSPASAESSFRRQVAAALPGARVTMACLGDERYAGTSLDEAISRMPSVHQPVARTRSLTALRARRAASTVAKSVGKVRRMLTASSENAGLLRASEQGDLVLAIAEVRGWQQHLQALREPIRTVDVADVVSTAQASASGAAIVKQAVLELRTRCGRTVKKTVKEVEQRLAADLERLASAVDRDFARARESLRAIDVALDTPAPNLRAMRTRLRPKLNEIANKAIDGIVMPDQLLVIAEFLGSGSHAVASASVASDAQKSGTKVGQPPDSEAAPPPNSDAGPPEDPSETSSEPESGDATAMDPTWRRLAEILANAPERLIVAKLHHALEEAVSEALIRCDHASDTTCTAWSAEVEELIESSFRPLHAASEACRHRIGTRLDSLSKVVGEMEQFDVSR